MSVDADMEKLKDLLAYLPVHKGEEAHSILDRIQAQLEEESAAKWLARKGRQEAESKLVEAEQREKELRGALEDIAAGRHGMAAGARAAASLALAVPEPTEPPLAWVEP